MAPIRRKFVSSFPLLPVWSASHRKEMETPAPSGMDETALMQRIADLEDQIREDEEYIHELEEEVKKRAQFDTEDSEILRAQLAASEEKYRLLFKESQDYKEDFRKEQELSTKLKKVR